MSCRFTEKISSLIDGELSTAEAREVEGHLLTCAQCEGARADFLSLRSQIISFEATQPGSVENRALAKILSSGRRERRAPRFGIKFGWNWGSGAVALASLAIVVLIIGWISFEKQPQQMAVNNVVAPTPSASPSPTVEPQKPNAQQP